MGAKSVEVGVGVAQNHVTVVGVHDKLVTTNRVTSPVPIGVEANARVIAHSAPLSEKTRTYMTHVTIMGGGRGGAD